MLRAVAERGFGQLRAWLASRYAAPEDWRRAAALSDWTLYLSAAEALALREEVYALFERFSDRLTDPARRPPDAEQVKAFVALHPLQLRRTP